MAQQFEFRSEDLAKHQCQTWQEGDAILMYCETCGFKRKMNWKTGEITVLATGDEMALHKANHAPMSMQEVKETLSFN